MKCNRVNYKCPLPRYIIDPLGSRKSDSASILAAVMYLAASGLPTKGRTYHVENANFLYWLGIGVEAAMDSGGHTWLTSDFIFL